MTLEGTNTYLVGRDPVVVIDPGPEDAGHIEVVRRPRRSAVGSGPSWSPIPTWTTSGRRAARHGARAARRRRGGRRADRAHHPGHTEDHLCFLGGKTLFCGDLILGEGSTIVRGIEGGSLVKYMASLERVGTLDLERLYPGHGPAVEDPAAKIAEYVEHRTEREDRLQAALERGERSPGLLREVWDDVPEPLLPAAAYAMQAHLEKLEAEGRVPGAIRLRPPDMKGRWQWT